MTIVAALVLLVGCANIAGLLLGRGAARRREIGVRLALGAGRGRLIRQLLTESLVLALLGGTVGGVLALWLSGSINLLVGRLPVPIELDLTLDRRMFVYTLALSLLTAVLCGLAPARSATRMTVVPALKSDDPMPERQRMRHWLVVGQVALSCALLLWAGLFARSLSNAHQVDLGFDPAGVVLAHLQFDDEDDAIGGDRALAGGVARTHERASRRSGSGAGQDRSARVQGPRGDAHAHGSRPAGPAWPMGARQSRQPRLVSDACGFRCWRAVISAPWTASGRRASWS